MATCDLVTTLQRPFFNLLHKIIRFSDIMRFSKSLWWDQKCHKIKIALYQNNPYSTNKKLIEHLFCKISILNSNSNNNLKALVTVKHRAWWLHCVFHISASWWFFDIILTYLITLLNTIIRKKKRAQLKSLPHKRYYFSLFFLSHSDVRSTSLEFKMFALLLQRATTKINGVNWKSTEWHNSVTQLSSQL